MTDKFNKCIPVILRNEGGFVNDSDDSGGATKYGISLHFLKGTGNLIDFDFDHDGDIDIDDIRLLTVEVGSLAYYRYFWLPMLLDQLKNDDLALQVFDMTVNAGMRQATRILQQVSGCKTDSIIGPKTIAAANTWSEVIVNRYRESRIQFYRDLVNKKPALKKFLKGWINRCNNTKF